MGQALYRKYRSKSFDDVVGQEHVTDTLKRAVGSGRISHAYLFTGPKGVGKTSVARILAHEINGLDYKDESPHLDIIEIDGASNRRIDEIRELRDKVHISPSSAKYKVYIIDEVHMLTREAFNALLKTLEEPPAHVVFILATTEAHKLPATIVSRTQRFEFKPIGRKNSVERLAKIAKNEKIAIDDKALELLAEHGDGSFRDSIGLLDQLSSGTAKISAEDVIRFLGLPPSELVENIINQIEHGDAKGVIDSLAELRDQGVNVSLTAKSLAKQLRVRLAEGFNQSWVAELLAKLVEIPASYDPEVSLEVALLYASLQNAGPQAPTAPKTAQQAASQPRPPKEMPAQASASPAVSATAGPRELDQAAWEEILEAVKKEAASLYTALRLAEPSLEGDALILSFQFPLHQKKLDQAKHKALVARQASNILGKGLRIEAVVKERSDLPEHSTAQKEDSVSPPQTISNIFGVTEVLESER